MVRLQNGSVAVAARAAALAGLLWVHLMVQAGAASTTGRQTYSWHLILIGMDIILIGMDIILIGMDIILIGMDIILIGMGLVLLICTSYHWYVLYTIGMYFIPLVCTLYHWYVLYTIGMYFIQ